MIYVVKNIKNKLGAGIIKYPLSLFTLDKMTEIVNNVGRDIS